MSYRLPPLMWLRAFDAAARHGNFAAAARELGMTQPAVSYQIRSLEEKLGAALFERHARRVELTRLGRAYLPSVQQTFAQLSASTSGLFGLTGAHEVTVHCAATLATLWLAPRLADFRRQHPGIDVRLYTSTWGQTDMPAPVDVDIRFAHSTDAEGAGTLLKRERLIAVCSPALAGTLGKPPTLADCAGQERIFVMGGGTYWSTWFDRGGLPGIETSQGIKVDNSVAALELAAAGYGLALVFETFARPYIDRGRLVQPVAHAFESDAAHYVQLARGGAGAAPEAVVFQDWLMRQAGAPA